MQNLAIVLSERVKEIKYSYYSDIIDKIRIDILNYINSNKLIIYASSHEILGVYCNNSVAHTKNIINKLNEKYSDEFWKLDDNSHMDFKIFGKRVNTNTIKIVFGGTDFHMILINVFDEKLYKQLSDYPNKFMISLLANYNTLVSACEDFAYQNDVYIYNFLKNHSELLIQAYDINASEIVLEKKEIKDTHTKDMIIIGINALQQVYGINLPKNLPKYNESIYIGKQNIFDVVKKMGTRYEIIKSDIEFTGQHFKIFDSNNTLTHIIYDGKNRTYQYYDVNGVRIGNYNLILRYFLLWIILSGGSTDIFYWLVKMRIKEHNKNINFYKYYGNYIGDKSSMYEQYYKNIWEDKPWNYTKVLHIIT